jgi:butyryl-CoA dehydrogenase
VPPTSSVSRDPSEARAFAESVAGVLDRHLAAPPDWKPGATAAPAGPELAAALTELGWDESARAPDLVACAGLAAVELGRRTAPVHHIDRLLGGTPLVGDLVRSLGPERLAIVRTGNGITRRLVVRAEPLASAGGLDVHRLLELGEPAQVPSDEWGTAVIAWLAAGVGYLAGVGQGALDLTTDYVRQRRAFGSTLAALAPVQQLLAGAATAVRGVNLLASEPAEGSACADALAHAGPAVAQACAACQQVTGAIGFTLEYPLHRHTQLARALTAWNDALLDRLIAPGD